MTSCEEWTCGHVLVDNRGAGVVGFRCPQCTRVSWNMNDLKHGWCDNCKRYTTEPHGDWRGND